MTPDLFNQPYFNTTHLKGKVLQEKKIKAESLADRILTLFKRSPEPKTPFEVQHSMDENNVPITSFRRAMTNLTDSGLLEKTEQQRTGEYGSLNYTWKLKI